MGFTTELVKAQVELEAPQSLIILTELGGIMWEKILLNILLCGLLAVSNSYAQSSSLRIVTEEWAPYNYKQDGTLKGFSVEIVQAIMKELKVEYEIELLPGARGEMLLDTEPNIMNFSLFRTDVREDKYKWIGPISKEAIYFYKRKNDPRIFKTLEDAKKVENISAPHKGLISSTLIKKGFKNIDPSPARKGQIGKLLTKRSDLAISITALGMVYYLKKEGIPVDALKQTPVKLFEFPLYIACSKGISDSVIERWQEALKKVKSSGKYEQIYNKYLN